MVYIFDGPVVLGEYRNFNCASISAITFAAVLYAVVTVLLMTEIIELDVAAILIVFWVLAQMIYSLVLAFTFISRFVYPSL